MTNFFKLLMLCICLSAQAAFGQTPTVGLLTHTSQSYDSGYVLFSPMESHTTYLIDKCGKIAHQWEGHYKPGLSTYLVEDGSILRTGTYNDKQDGFSAGGRGGVIEKLSWNNNLMWSGVISDSSQCQHHDIYPLPNGNILAIVWEFIDRKVAIDAGRDTGAIGNSVWSEKIVELQPMPPSGYNIVWEWRVWDHLIQNRNPALGNFGTVENHPELIDLNFYKGNAKNEDWLHINGIDYNMATDQIMLSVHNWSEIWVIDHSTNTFQAAGHDGGLRNKGGDLLWRWGNPEAYGRGDSTNQMLFQQHNAHWIKDGLPNAGKILVFNNGLGRPEGAYSTVEIISPPADQMGNYDPSIPFGPSVQDWIYKDPTSPQKFYASFISGAQMLPNGNVLICSGTNGTFFEVTPDKKTAWKYISPVNANGRIKQGTAPTQNTVFRCTFYGFDYPAVRDRHLTQGTPVEANPINYTCKLNIKTGGGQGTGIETVFNSGSFSVYPNPASSRLVLSAPGNLEKVSLYNLIGVKVMEMQNVHELDISALPQGIYVVKALYDGTYYTQKFTIAR
jgi:hypothetical protein